MINEVDIPDLLRRAKFIMSEMAEALGEVGARNVIVRPMPPDIAELLKNVSAEYGMSSDQIKMRIKTRRYVNARTEFCLRARELGYSLSDIGKCLGGKHHTTVLHMLRKKRKGNRRVTHGQDAAVVE